MELDLQFEITLSTLKVEYISLSQGMKVLIAGKILLVELGDHVHFDLHIVSKVSYDWEDNIGT